MIYTLNKDENNAENTIVRSVRDGRDAKAEVKGSNNPIRSVLPNDVSYENLNECLILRSKNLGLPYFVFKENGAWRCCISVDKEALTPELLAELKEIFARNNKSSISTLVGFSSRQQDDNKKISYTYKKDDLRALFALDTVSKYDGRDHSLNGLRFNEAPLGMSTPQEMSQSADFDTLSQSISQFTALVNKLTKEIKDANLSPFETILFLNKELSKYQYHLERTPFDQLPEEKKSILSLANSENSNYRQSYAMSLVAKEVINRLNNPDLACAVMSVDLMASKKSSLDSHSQLLVRIKDEKYNIEGVYISDPTYSILNTNATSYATALVPLSDTQYYLRGTYSPNVETRAKKDIANGAKVKNPISGDNFDRGIFNMILRTYLYENNLVSAEVFAMTDKQLKNLPESVLSEQAFNDISRLSAASCQSSNDCANAIFKKEASICRSFSGLTSSMNV